MSPSRVTFPPCVAIRKAGAGRHPAVSSLGATRQLSDANSALSRVAGQVETFRSCVAYKETGPSPPTEGGGVEKESLFVGGAHQKIREDGGIRENIGLDELAIVRNLIRNYEVPGLCCQGTLRASYSASATKSPLSL